MAHYVCDGGCKGVSEYVGYCQSPGCPHQGQELKGPCECDDGKHADFLSNVDPDNATGDGADDFAG